MNPIEELVKARREAALHKELPEEATKIWGLALSGGGIRSATFCFGLLRAFACRNFLLRFDLMSTVSGGGYIGATLGRLLSRCTSAAQVQDVDSAFDDASSRWFAWWLRANGRYLIPRGAKDRTYAIALYIRNLVAVHFELGLLAVLIGVVLALVDIGGWKLLSWLGYTRPELVFAAARFLPDWLPVVAFLIPIVAALGCIAAVAYWCVPWLVGATDRRRRQMVLLKWIGVLVFAVVLLRLKPLLGAVHTDVGDTLRTVLGGVTFFLVATWVLAVPFATVVLYKIDNGQSTQLRADAARTRLTGWLANCLRAATLLVLVGVVDRTAWFMAFEYTSLGQTGLVLAVIAALIRALLPTMTGLMPGRSSTSVLLMFGRLVGYLLTFAVAAWWVSIVYRSALGAGFQRSGPNFSDALLVLTFIGVPVAGYLLITGRNLAFLNLSSLHAFYRARLIRSYLGAANGKRFGLVEPNGALSKLPSPMPVFPTTVSVGDPQRDDDITLDQYLPQRYGGPVHLINVCVNQTRDPRGGLFNQDRRGLALSVASGGYMQVAQEGWKSMQANSAMTLGTWTAISGAAVAPGLGGLTRGGISALATFAGLRLGFWWDSDTREGAANDANDANNDATKAPKPKWAGVAKTIGLVRETFGIFRGTDNPDWFLTDGGHFENTGAYALLAERAEVIVLADCGADPTYAFGDIENLVRKARIDLQAEIYFHKPRLHTEPDAAPADDGPAAVKPRFRTAKPPAPVTEPWPAEMEAFGSLNDLASPASTACLAMATVQYGGARPGTGVIILIKPNISNGLPVDLVNFKAENPAFPQEATADQFFSEAQWESYSQLGYFLGAKLTTSFIEGIVAQPERYFERDEQSPLDAKEKLDAKLQSAKASVLSRLPARIGSAAVSTGIGLGAAATIGVSAWQAIDSVRTSNAKQTADERSALKELTDLWAKVAPPSQLEAPGNVAAVGALAAAIVRTADTLCPSREAGWFQTSPVAGSVYDTALQQCGLLADSARPTPCTVLLEAAHPSLQSTLPNCLVRSDGAPQAVPPPRYWVYDYADDAPFVRAHPCDPVAAVRRKAQTDYAYGILRLESVAAVNAANAAPIEMPEECANAVPAPTVPDSGAEAWQGSSAGSGSGSGSGSSSAQSGRSGGDVASLPPTVTRGIGSVIRRASDAWSGAVPATRSLEPPKGASAPSPASSTEPVPAAGPPVEPAAPAPLQPPVEAARPAPAPAPAPVPVPDDICAGTTVYTQVYGADQRAAARQFQKTWRTFGATVPAVEDFFAAARGAGRAPPLAVSTTTVRYHDAASRNCALALGPVVGARDWKVEPLSPRLKAMPGVVEVWIAVPR
ncbi:hypothetical protein BH09PSE5_BH09PSE5_49330 [soil metagenome]